MYRERSGVEFLSLIALYHSLIVVMMLLAFMPTGYSALHSKLTESWPLFSKIIDTQLGTKVPLGLLCISVNKLLKNVAMEHS